MLEISKLYAGYKKDLPILQDFSLTLQQGERIGIVGQNGSGKSTLAKTIMGIAPYTSGKIQWQGVSLLQSPVWKRQQQGIGYFIQGGRIFGNLSVKDNMKMAMQNNRLAVVSERLKQLADSNMPLFGDSRRLNMLAANLSGGERHLLAFMMTISACPTMKLLIADEPSAGIAQNTQTELLMVIDSFLKQNNVSLLLIEQNRRFLERLTERTMEITND